MSGLAVGQGDSVITDSGMLGSQASYGYCFQSADTSVIFYGHSGKVFHRVGDLQGVQVFQGVFGEDLQGSG